MVNDKIVNDLVMKKKIYSIPHTEVAAMAGTCNIMKTSIDPLVDPAPKRRDSAF